jgi:hypothetical protein
MYVTAASFSAAGPKADGAAIELLRGRLGPERPLRLPRAAIAEADAGRVDAGDGGGVDALKPQPLLSKASAPAATKGDFSDGVWTDVAAAFGFNGEGGDGWLVGTGEAYARAGAASKAAAAGSEAGQEVKSETQDEAMARIAAAAETEDEFVARHMAQLRAKAALGAIMGRTSALP